MSYIIPKQFRINPVGSYNPGVYSCNNCSFIAKDYNVIPYALGFFEIPQGIMLAWECPHCFKKWFFHARLDERSSFNYLQMFDSYKSGDKDWRSAAFEKNYEFRYK